MEEDPLYHFHRSYSTITKDTLVEQLRDVSGTFHQCNHCATTDIPNGGRSVGANWALPYQSVLSQPPPACLLTCVQFRGWLGLSHLRVSLAKLSRKEDGDKPRIQLRLLLPLALPTVALSASSPQWASPTATASKTRAIATPSHSSRTFRISSPITMIPAVTVPSEVPSLVPGAAALLCAAMARRYPLCRPVCRMPWHSLRFQRITASAQQGAGGPTWQSSEEAGTN